MGPDELMERHMKIERLYLINAGLDILYIGTGAYLSHLIEKEYTHAYLETLWNACLEEPWPRRVAL